MPAVKPLRRHFIDQVLTQLSQSAVSAQRLEADAIESARALATESEKKEDSRTMLEYGSLATAHANRSRKALAEWKTLDDLVKRGIPEFSGRSPVGIGAIVDVATRDAQGTLERTFILLPVGGSMEIEGPGGDGFLTVITPTSPVGQALMGKRAGDIVEVEVKGEVYDWEIIEVG